MLNQFLEEKKSGGKLYDYTQVEFAYNDLKLDGVPVQKEIVESLFKGDAPVQTKNEQRVKNHFTLFDFILDTANDPVTEDYIKNCHRIIEHDIDPTAGQYRAFDSRVDELKGAAPSSQIEKLMAELADKYQSAGKKQTHLTECLVRFEKIQPFTSSNGTIARMLLFKESLRQNEIPPLIYAGQKTSAYHIKIRTYDEDPVAFYRVINKSRHKYAAEIEKL